MRIPKMIADISIEEIRSHYDQRSAVHRQLSGLVASRAHKRFAELALGVADPKANYSAAEHTLGPRILLESAPREIFRLAQQLNCCRPDDVPSTIYAADIPWLKLSVGSEIAMMLRPGKVWLANTRSIWAHLLVKHRFNRARANSELKLYRDEDDDSEMQYEIWSAIFRDMRPNFEMLADFGVQHARSANVAPGRFKYLWADTVANALYARYADTRRQT